LPEAILGPILNEAAKLAGVPVQQLVIVRAEAVVWNDGSLGCPEPGMEYAQALINGYWVLISRQRDRCMTFAWVAAAAFAYVRTAVDILPYHPTLDETACDVTRRTR
jgi:hypothetical protein